MLQKSRNFAFIDQQNLHTELKKCGWELDYERFRIYLKEKHSIERAYIFIGYIPGYEDIYEVFNKCGFECIFKPISRTKSAIKGNCDSELVLHSIRLIDSYDEAIVITGDGDFACLVEHLLFHNKLKALIVPNRGRYSGLLKRFRQQTIYMNDLRQRTEKKTPLGTEP